MQLFLPYNNADLHISTKYTGELEFTLPNDLSLHQDIMYQFFTAMSYQEFINTIGTQQFEKLIEFYISSDFKE